MVCPSNHALTNYNLEKAADGRIRYAYECCSIYRSLVSVESTQEVETDQTIWGLPLEVQYLDRQTPKCPGKNQLIGRLRMRSSNSHIWYSLTCIQLATGFIVDAGATQTSSTFEIGSLLTYALDQVELGCDSSQYLLSTKLSMTYATNLYTASFAIQRGGIW